MMSFSLFRRAACALVAAALLAGPALPAPAATPDKIVFAWPGPISIGIAPLAFAKALGLFKKEDLDIDVVNLDGSGVIIPQLLNGSVFTSFLTYDPLIASRAPGKPNFDYKFVFNSVRNSMWEISVLDGSPIHSIKDLAGKTVGVGALSFGNLYITKAMLKREGVDPANVTFVPVGVGVGAFQALKTGKVDALNLFDIPDTELALQGTRIRLVPLPAEYQGISSHGYAVTNAMIREHPDLVVKFGRLSAEGMDACLANLKGCLDAYWAWFPNAKPSPNEEEALKETLPILNVRLNNMNSWPPGAPHAWGSFPARDIPTWTSALQGGGEIPAGVKIDPNTIYTNQFVAQYNRYDKNAIVKLAKAYK